MARKRHTAEEIVGKLRQVAVLTGQGKPVSKAISCLASLASSRGARPAIEPMTPNRLMN